VPQPGSAAQCSVPRSPRTAPHPPGLLPRRGRQRRARRHRRPPAAPKASCSPTSATSNSSRAATASARSSPSAPPSRAQRPGCTPHLRQLPAILATHLPPSRAWLRVSVPLARLREKLGAMPRGCGSHRVQLCHSLRSPPSARSLRIISRAVWLTATTAATTTSAQKTEAGHLYRRGESPHDRGLPAF
jgi:hypothetical protein